MKEMENFDHRCQRYRAAIEEYLQGLFTAKQPYDRLQEAMRYSLLAGGKRIRPILTLAFCETQGGDIKTALPLAGAIELIHTYSLIHDDLPCMDDDDLRRGNLTCHMVYGEATAVLAGDALQAEAFRLIASAPELDAGQKNEAVLTLARACGGDGMVAGQLLDVEQLASGEGELRMLCRLKTGAMIRAAAELGCIAANSNMETRKRAAAYAGHLGLAFQVRDDMLDVTASTTELGKPAGSDKAAGKRTFADVLGLERCKELVSEETRWAKEAAADFKDRRFLSELADSLMDRRK